MAGRILRAGRDVDTDELARRIHALADAIENGDALVNGVNTDEWATVDDATERTLTVEYLTTAEYGGVDIPYDFGDLDD